MRSSRTMESPEKYSYDCTPADSTTAAGVIPSSSFRHSGHKRRHRRHSEKHQKILGDMSPKYETSSEVRGMPSPHRHKKSKESRKASCSRAGGLSPDLNSCLQETNAASSSASAPALKSLPEPAPASAPEKRPCELTEPGAAEITARGFASPTMSTLGIAAVPAMWSPIKKADEDKNQAQ
ncbi:uncharacterized protein LOC144133804 [Amblyomma americanum]